MIQKILFKISLIVSLFSFQVNAKTLDTEPNLPSLQVMQDHKFMMGGNVLTGDRAFGTSINAGYKLIPNFYLVAEVGSYHYHNMDFGMNSSTGKLGYSLSCKSIFARYELELPNFPGFSLAGMIGLENLNGDVTLAVPRTANGDKSHFDKTFFVLRPLIILNVNNFLSPSLELFFTGGLNLRLIKSYKVSTTREFSNDADINNSLPDSLSTMLVFNAGIRF